MNFREENDCWIVLKSRTEFCAFADLSNTFHHPPQLHVLLRVIEQQVNFLIHYKSDCGYKKGIILHTNFNGRDFVVL